MDGLKEKSKTLTAAPWQAVKPHPCLSGSSLIARRARTGKSVGLCPLSIAMKQVNRLDLHHKPHTCCLSFLAGTCSNLSFEVK